MYGVYVLLLALTFIPPSSFSSMALVRSFVQKSKCEIYYFLPPIVIRMWCPGTIYLFLCLPLRLRYTIKMYVCDRSVIQLAHPPPVGVHSRRVSVVHRQANLQAYQQEDIICSAQRLQSIASIAFYLSSCYFHLPIEWLCCIGHTGLNEWRLNHHHAQHCEYTHMHIHHIGQPYLLQCWSLLDLATCTRSVQALYSN